MKILKSFTLKWWQAALYETTMMSLGAIIGASYPDQIKPRRGLLAILYLLAGGYLFAVWLRQTPADENRSVAEDDDFLR